MALFRIILILFFGSSTSILLAASSPVEDQWSNVLSGEHRLPENIQRNSHRHPRETLIFFGVTPSSTVVEVWPGGGWYTEILAPLLKNDGVFYAAHFSINSHIPFYRIKRQKFDQKIQAAPDVYGKVITTTLMPPQHILMAPNNSVDVVLTFRNVHNWMKSGKDAHVFSAMFAALKPGGVLGVVEHRAKPGTPLVDMIGSGYVTEAEVKRMAGLAGFVFTGNSEINANVNDSTLHPKGVWTLPPSLRLGDESRDHYLSIGESDRMTLKFIKPLN
ncbi:MAG: putative methyltransferase [Pseudohongiellaceae bacterium]|jgi:predicted methyltransferase